MSQNTSNLPAASHIRIASDIHLDFDVPKKNFKFEMLWVPEPLPTDSESILLLVGDMWHAGKLFSYYGRSWAKEQAARFKYVIFVLGNHDFWGGSFPHEYLAFSKALKDQGIDNAFLLQDSSIVIGNHKFVGATLWTNFMNAHPMVMMNATNVMADYKYIKYGSRYEKLKPARLLGANHTSKNYIFDNAKKDYDDQKVWVLTHHLPSEQSVNIRYQSASLAYDNALYYSEYGNEIADSEIDVWVHGHSHFAQDYMINNTQILANPRGYPGEDSNFNPWLCIDI